MAEDQSTSTIAPRNDLTGTRFGRLTVVTLADRRKKAWRWLCRCDCGNERIVWQSHLTAGRTLSCRCLAREVTRARSITHGCSPVKRATPEYRTWNYIITRCENPKSKNYPDYGGRGIRICPAWRESFETFLADVGPRPSAGHSIDRYPDVNGHYEPGNVRWATKKQQMRNTRRSRMLTLNGREQCIAAWSEELNLSQDVIGARLQRGWSDEQTLTTPVRPLTRA